MLHSAGAIIVTHDKRILLQRRDDKAGQLGVFGGFLEAGETAVEALCRELREELGAHVSPDELRPVLTRAYTLPDGQPITLHHFLWFETTPRITGIFEGGAAHFSSVTAVLDSNESLSGSTRHSLIATQTLLPEDLR